MTLTVDELKEALPAQVRKTINQELVDIVTSTINEPEFYQAYRDNLVSYGSIIQDGRFKVADYLHAVKYVSYKLMGSTNFDAYIKTFPDRYAKHVSSGIPLGHIQSYVSMYNKNKLVNLVFAQSIIPTHVLNQDMYQKALNTQFDLMNDINVSPKVRSDAANSLMVQLRPPEVSKVQLDVQHKVEGSAIGDLKDAMTQLIAQQRSAIQAGVLNAKDVAEVRLVGSNSDE
jgi:hypothetical protein